MTLYEINEQIEDILTEGVDDLTGELIIPDDAITRLQELQMSQEEKVENICCFIKNLSAEAMAIKMEEERLGTRRSALEKKVERLKGYLKQTVAGVNFGSARFKLTWRNSETTEIPDDSILPKKYLKKTVSYKPDKTAIKEALKSGLKVKGAFLQSNANPQIK